MVIQTNVTINGVNYIKSYSDQGMMIERDGIKYAEALDPLGSDRTYVETDEPIAGEQISDELALKIILGQEG